MNNDLFFSSKDQTWETPKEFFKTLDSEFHFTLDPCATAETAKCAKYYTVSEDGLLQDWTGETVFCNPPYGKEIGKWVEKCFWEHLRGATVVMLIPARTDTAYFHNYIYPTAELRFIRGRLKFGNAKTGAPFPSMLVIWRNNPETGQTMYDILTRRANNK